MSQVRVPERDRIVGVCYALTDDGVELPVLDVTHPAFAVDVRPEGLPGLEAEAIAGLRRAARLPRAFGRLLALRSAILRGTLRARGGVLDAMTTYLYKLGPRNLGRGAASRLDRQLGAQLGPVAARLRFHAHVGLAADALEAALAAGGERPARVLNLGGGTAADSLAALIALRKRRPALLEARSLTIDVLDLDPVGPAFGSRALAALRAPGGPLEGQDLRLRRIRYDWSRPWELRSVYSERSRAEVVQCLSEGALLEYAPERVVAANLEVLRGLLPEGCPLLATALRPAPIVEVWREVSGMPFQARTEEELRALVERSGWAVARSAQGNPVYHVVELRAARAGRPEGEQPQDCVGEGCLPG